MQSLHPDNVDHSDSIYDIWPTSNSPSDNGTMEGSQTIDEAKSAALIEERAQAVRNKDVNRAMSHIARDIVSLYVANPLQYRGSDSLRRRAEGGFSSFGGPIGFEVRGLSILYGGDLGTKKVGKKLEISGTQALATAKLTAYNGHS